MVDPNAPRSRRAFLSRLFVMASATAATGALAACGGSGTAAATASTVPTTAAAAPTSASAATTASPAASASQTTSIASATATTAASSKAAAGKAVELNFYYPVGVSGPLAKLISDLSASFTKDNPSTKITPIFSGSYLDTLAKVQQQIQAGAPPDVAIINAAAIYTLTDSGSIIALDDLIKTSGGDSYINDFFPAFLMNSQLGGKTWSIPFQRSTLICYYNKDMFQKVGLDANTPPKNWTELVDMGKKLTQRENGKVSVWGVGFPSDGSNYWEFQALAIEAGQNVFKNDAGNVVYFNAQPTVDGLQFLVDISKQDGVMQSGTVAWGTLPTDFDAQKVAIIYHSTGSLTSVLTGAKFQVGAAFCPADKQFGTPTGGGNLYLFKGTPTANQDAAWSFIQWLTTPDRQAQWTVDTGYVAARKSSWDTTTMKNYVAKTPQVTVARDQLQYAQNELGTHNMAEVQTILSNAIQAAVVGQQTPKAALDAAQKQAEQILSAYKS